MINALILMMALNVAAPRETVFIQEVRTINITSDMVNTYNDIVADTVNKFGIFDVATKDEVQARFNLEEMKDALGCDEISCLAELSGAIGARYVVLGSVAKLSGGYTIGLTLTDTAGEGKTTRVREIIEEVDEMAALKKLPEVVHKLFNQTFGDEVIPPNAIVAHNPAEPVPLAVAQVGDIVLFGHYEQDGNLENGPEPIEWIVRNRVENYLTLYTKKVIDYRPYHARKSKTTWEKSSMRRWLNNEFKATAFSEAERKMMYSTMLANRINPDYGTKSGKRTEDFVALFSVKEVERTAAEKLIAEPTIAVKKRKGNSQFSDNDYISWCLRTSGKTGKDVVYVTPSGEIMTIGTSNVYPCGVRPFIGVILQ